MVGAVAEDLYQPDADPTWWFGRAPQELAPEHRDGRCDDPIAEAVHARTGVEYESCDEHVGVAVPQGRQMPGRLARGGGVSLDLHRDETAAGKLGQQVDLEPALLLAHVVQPRGAVDGC